MPKLGDADDTMAMASRNGIGKIAAAVIVIAMVAIVVGAGGFFASQGPPVTLTPETIVSTSHPSSSASATQSTCTAGATVTESIGQSGPPCGCVLVDSNSNGSLYVSPDPKVGDSVCVEASLDDSAQVSLSITNSAGSVVFSGVCVATGQTRAPAPTGDTCTAFWNTANPDPQGNAIEAGNYHLVASGSTSAVQLEANFTLS